VREANPKLDQRFYQKFQNPANWNQKFFQILFKKLELEPKVLLKGRN
jgi:hypothetical protein